MRNTKSKTAHRPTRFDMELRRLTNEVIGSVYIASSSCHGHLALKDSKHEFHGMDIVREIAPPHLRDDLVRMVSNRLINHRHNWRLWVSTYYKTEDGTDVNTDELVKVYDKEIMSVVSDDVGKIIGNMIISSDYDAEAVCGFSWCVFPTDDFDIESNANALHKYFIECGVDDVTKSRITFNKKEATNV